METTIKKGDKVRFNKTKIEQNIHNKAILNWMQHDRLKYGEWYKVREVGSSSLVLEEGDLAYPFYIFDVEVSHPVPRTKEERMQWGQQVLQDMFSSDERFNQYVKLYNDKDAVQKG